MAGPASAAPDAAEAASNAAGPSRSVTPSRRRALPVLAAVVQHPTGDVRDDVELGRVCTGEPGSFRLASPGSDLTVYPLAGTCPGGLSIPTNGTLDLTFTR